MAEQTVREIDSIRRIRRADLHQDWRGEGQEHPCAVEDDENSEPMPADPPSESIHSNDQTACSIANNCLLHVYLSRPMRDTNRELPAPIFVGHAATAGLGPPRP